MQGVEHCSGTRSAIDDFHLFVLAAVGVYVLALKGLVGTGVEHSVGGFTMSAILHTCLSIHNPCFDRLRRWTWILFGTAWMVTEVISFMRFIVPSGQVLFLLSTYLPLPFIEFLDSGFETGELYAFLSMLLVADVCVMHRHVILKRSTIEIIAILGISTLAGVGAAYLVADRLTTSNPSSDSSQFIWYLLPSEAMLRSVSDKLTGVLILFAGHFGLVLLPFIRLSKSRTPQTLAARTAAWFGLIAAYITLGLLAAIGPSNKVTLLSKFAVGAFFCCLLAMALLTPKKLRSLDHR